MHQSRKAQWVGAVLLWGLTLVLMAGLPGSTTSFSGGTSLYSAYTMTMSWTPSLAAASDEFSSNTSASWTLQAAGGTGTTVISPLSTPSVSLFNFGTTRSGWLHIQAESGFAAVASKSYTLPTNIALWVRGYAGNRSVTPSDNDLTIGVGFAATSAGAVDLNNIVYCSNQAAVIGSAGRMLVKNQAGVVSIQPSTPPPGSAVYRNAQRRHIMLIQKRGSVYHCYNCLDDSGACAWTGSTTWGGAATLDRVMLYTVNSTATAPGPGVASFDYFRVIEADNVFP